MPLDGGSLQGETFARHVTQIDACACLTVSKTIVASPPLTDLAPTGLASLDGIPETDEKPMYKTIQEELDVLERMPLDECGSIEII